MCIRDRSKEELAFIRPFVPQINEDVTIEEQHFIKTSQSKRKKQQNLLRAIIFIAFSLLLLGIAYVKVQEQNARSAEQTAIEQKKVSDNLRLEAEAERSRADSLRKIAETSEANALSLLRTLTQKNFSDQLRQVEMHLDSTNFSAADSSLQAAKTLITSYNDANEIPISGDTTNYFQNRINNQKEVFPSFSEAINKAERFAVRQKYIEAIAQYELALETNIKRREVDLKIQALEMNGYDHYTNKGEQHEANGTPIGIKLGISNLQKALKIWSNSTVVQLAYPSGKKNLRVKIKELESKLSN